MGVKPLLLLLVLLQLAFVCKAYRENYREEDELEDERRMRDVDVNGRTKYVDLDKEKQIKGTPPPSKDEIIQHDIENDEGEWDMKEDEKDMMVDEFEDVDEGETTAMNDRNKHVLTGTNQEKQDPYVIVHYYRRRYLVYYYRRRNLAPYRRRRRRRRWLGKK